MRNYGKSERHEEAWETAERLIKKGHAVGIIKREGLKLPELVYPLEFFTTEMENVL